MLVRFACLIAGSCLAVVANDRPVAEWVLRMGGSVIVEGSSSRINELASLPAGDFRLHTVRLINTVVPPKDFQRLSGLEHLKELYISGRSWHSMPEQVSATTLGYFSGLTNLETFVLTLPVQTEIPLTDVAVAKLNGLVN